MNGRPVPACLARGVDCRLWWALLVAAAGLGLAACTVGPDYRPPQPALPDHYQALAPGQASVSGADRAPAYEGSPPGAGRGDVDLDQWWRGFDDPALTGIVGRVLAGNLDLAAAQARVAQARAAARGAGADLLPAASLAAGVQREHQSTVGEFGTVASHLPGYYRDQTVRQLGAGASWELDLAGGLHRRAEALRDEAQAVDAAGLGTRISMAAEAADAYFQVRSADARLALLQAQVEVDQALLRVIDERVREGVAIDRERDDAQAQLARDRAELPPLRAQRVAQSNRLDVLVGVAPGSGVPAGGEAPGGAAAMAGNEAQVAGGAVTGHDWRTPGLPAGTRPSQLLRRRPDVIAAERRLAAANAGIGVALAGYYPDVSLSALLGFERLGAGDLFSGAAFQPALLAGVHWRLFDFGRVDAEVAQARGAQAEALAQYRQAVLRAAEDAEDALVTLAQTAERVRARQAVVAADEHALQSTQRSAEAGTASEADLLRRRLPLLEARRAWVAASAEQARAAVDAYRALGGGWAPDAVRQYGSLTATPPRAGLP